jgi:hypothetical protein
MPNRADHHDEDHNDPNGMGVEGGKRPHGLIRQQWQDNQRGGGEDQSVPEFDFAETGADKTVERRSGAQ